MAVYPQIGSRLVTQRPFTSALEYETMYVDMETGRRWSFPLRESGLSGFPGKPLRRASLNYPSITDSEVEELRTFFRARKGRYESFQFLDPTGNLLFISEDFSDGYWAKTQVSVGSTVSDPFGGTDARSLTATGSNGTMTAYFCPNGGVSGYRFCASVWVYAESSSQQLFVGFLDAGGSTTVGTTWSIPQNSWRRIFHSADWIDGNAPRMIVGGSGTWNSTTIRMFGAQVVPLLGEGAYAKSPVNYGYHPTMRFDTDSFRVVRLSPNQNSVSLPVVELD